MVVSPTVQARSVARLAEGSPERIVPNRMSTSVYVHFPWCLQKCPYCDFASATIRRPEVPHTHYADAVLRELERHRESLPSGDLASVFFGGGTPSLWSAEELGRVLAAIREAFGVSARDAQSIE